MNKPKVIRRFESLPEEVRTEILRVHPYGFDKKLITFKNHKGQLISALPYETEEFHYLVKMTRTEAQSIHEQEYDLDDDSNDLQDIEQNVPVPDNADLDD